jgi:hypothetical protein
MNIRKAERADCHALAELAMMAGEGIPAFFWQQELQQGEDLIDAGARILNNKTENFSYRNAVVAEIDGEVAGMMLAYRLPSGKDADDLDELPEFIRPLVELEQCVPESYYINMVATSRVIAVALWEQNSWDRSSNWPDRPAAR